MATYVLTVEANDGSVSIDSHQKHRLVGFDHSGYFATEEEALTYKDAFLSACAEACRQGIIPSADLFLTEFVGAVRIG